MLTALFDLAQTGTDIAIRHRRAGDRFRPLGLPAEKKLNQFMIDARIPHSWRDRIPIVCSPDRILWVVGYRTDESAKVTEKTRRVLEITLTRS